jgi:hypothetical protein
MQKKKKMDWILDHSISAMSPIYIAGGGLIPNKKTSTRRNVQVSHELGSSLNFPRFGLKNVKSFDKWSKVPALRKSKFLTGGQNFQRSDIF